MDQATNVPESLNQKIVDLSLVTFTVTGLFVVALYTFQFFRLMLSLFVLSGKPVFVNPSDSSIPVVTKISLSFEHSANPPKHGLS